MLCTHTRTHVDRVIRDSHESLKKLLLKEIAQKLSILAVIELTKLTLTLFLKQYIIII